MHDTVPPICGCKSSLVIASFNFFISRYNIAPNLEHTTFFIYVPNGSIFLNIYSHWGKLYSGLAQKHMEIIDLYTVFSTPEEILLRD